MAEYNRNKERAIKTHPDDRNEFWLEYMKETWVKRESVSGKHGRAINREEFNTIAREVSEILDFHPEDLILDIGAATATMAIGFSGYVAKVVAVDPSVKLIKEATKYVKENKIDNVSLHIDTFPNLSKLENKKFTKIYCGSVLQYLNNLSEIGECLNRTFELLEDSGKALFFHHYDSKKKKYYPNSHWWKNEMLWFSLEDVRGICKEIGFSSVEEVKISHSNAMSTHRGVDVDCSFNFVLKK